MIEVKNISKRYGEFSAVTNVTFSAKKGDIVGFLGPNGAGKTSTIRMLATYAPPSSGTATVAGFDVIQQPDEVRKRIGYLPENPPLYPEMTVREYLRFVGQIKGVPARELAQRVKSTMDRCFVADVADKLCSTLSRGYRQRVGIAQAIIHDPQVIILDEPTSGLDPKQIIEIRRLIKSLGDDHTVILSTHILPEVTMVCNKVVIINRGAVVMEKPLSELTKERSLEEIFISAISSDAASSSEPSAPEARAN